MSARFLHDVAVPPYIARAAALSLILASLLFAARPHCTVASRAARRPCASASEEASFMPCCRNASIRG